MDDGYTTPVEQIIPITSRTCPNAPLRKVLRPEFQEPLNSNLCQKLALPPVEEIRRTIGGLTLKGYGSKKNTK